MVCTCQVEVILIEQLLFRMPGWIRAVKVGGLFKEWLLLLIAMISTMIQSKNSDNCYLLLSDVDALELQFT